MVNLNIIKRGKNQSTKRISIQLFLNRILRKALVEVHSLLLLGGCGLLLSDVLLQSFDEGLHVAGRGRLNCLVAELELANERRQLAGLKATREKAKRLLELE